MEFNKPQSEEELADLHARIKLLKGSELSNAQVIMLGNIMAESDSGGLRDIIAIKFADANNRSCVPFLIEALKRNIHTQYVSSLIYACSKYDCSEYLHLFVDILILKKDMSFVDAWYTIKNMKDPISDLERIYAANKLRAFLLVFDKNHELYEEIEYAIEMIENKD